MRLALLATLTLATAGCGATCPSTSTGRGICRVARPRRLARLGFETGAKLGEALLALPHQLLNRNELLLHGEEVRSDIPTQLNGVGVLGNQRLPQRRQRHEHRVGFGLSRCLRDAE